MTGDEFAAIIAAGRFDATRAQAEVAWDYYRNHADLICSTENGSGKFDSAIRAPGWDSYRGHGECVVAWRRDRFTLASHRLSPRAERIGSTFWRGGNPRARTPLTTVALTHLASGRVVLARVPHMPAHVQSGDGFARSSARVVGQVAAWVSSLAALGRRSRLYARAHPGDAQVFASDWNVDVRRRHWRSLLARGLSLRCALPLTAGGDLGHRLVTWAFVRRLRVRGVGLCLPMPGYDHRAVRLVLSIKSGSTDADAGETS